MTSARIAQAAFGLIAVMAATLTAPFLAADVDAACVTAQHQCDRTVMITSSCCDDHGDGPSQAGPVEARVQLMLKLTPAAIPVSAAAMSTTWVVAVRPHTSPPRDGPLDLPTRLARLLI